MTKRSEQEVAAQVVAYLEDCGHDVYQEVEVRGGVADIVALAGAELWIVETKTSWSLELLDQCVARRDQAHRVFAAVPWARQWKRGAFIARRLGIGSFEVHFPLSRETWTKPVELFLGELPPRTSADQRQVRYVRDRLSPEHKTHARAGAPGGAGRWTPFRNTCEQVARVVRERPGCSLKEAIETVKHHYSSHACARASIAKWAESGKVPGVRLEREGRSVRLYPAEAA